jgi:hypothetical protein
MGQIKEVTTIRFVMADTFEEVSSLLIKCRKFFADMLQASG